MLLPAFAQVPGVISHQGKITVSGTNTPGRTLSVNGTVQSAAGGFMFPDGTLQTTAATNTTSSGGGGSSSTLVEAFLGSDLSLSANSQSQIPFNTTAINAGSALSGSGAFTVPTTGNYTIQCTVVSPSTAAHVAMVSIFDNGALFYAGPGTSGINTVSAISYGYVATVSYTGPLAAGHVLTFYVAINNVSSVAASSGSSLARTSLLIVKLP